MFCQAIMSCGEDGHANYNSSLFAVVIRLPELSGQHLLCPQIYLSWMARIIGEIQFPWCNLNGQCMFWVVLNFLSLGEIDDTILT